LLHTRFELPFRKALVTVVDRFELAAVDRHNRVGEQIQVAAQGDELAADSTDCLPVIFAEISNRLEVWCQLSGEPYQLQISLRLAFETAAGLNSVEIAVDVDLKQGRWMISGPTGGFGFHAVEA